MHKHEQRRVYELASASILSLAAVALINAAITTGTKPVAVVHYPGVFCEMDTIMGIAKLEVIEDAAQWVLAFYRGRTPGSIDDLGAYNHVSRAGGIGGC